MAKLPFNIYDVIKNKDNVVPPETFPGIYRAIVKDISDTQNRARIKVLIPAIHDENEKIGNLPWADCCSNVAGPDRGILRVPDVNDVVYIMFEQGDKEYPVWLGSWWGKNDLPSEVPKGNESDHLVIKQGEGFSIDISDENGDKYISISTQDGTEVKLDETGKEIIIAGGSTTTRISITPGTASGVYIGNNPITPCNDFPNCLFTGAPHNIGTDLNGNRIMIP